MARPGRSGTAPHLRLSWPGRLVNFWEYTCINCIRDSQWSNAGTQVSPYGFEVIGVHFGEFNIGFNVDNVRWQRSAIGCVASGRRSGGQPGKHTLPMLARSLLIDPQGNIVMKIFGEGYDREWKTRFASCSP